MKRAHLCAVGAALAILRLPPPSLCLSLGCIYPPPKFTAFYNHGVSGHLLRANATSSRNSLVQLTMDTGTDGSPSSDPSVHIDIEHFVTDPFPTELAVDVAKNKWKYRCKVGTPEAIAFGPIVMRVRARDANGTVAQLQIPGPPYSAILRCESRR
ncbi:unnamed protein product [Vitrella brassicaformis CCMP3155]|uniref:Uncharacterized protein n=1 Tax=Vitrella brassicaformis (strain CCMP3155) TaxID=1169540 RepID=A0A0G4F6A0_VITBC|nr:unnamed protein product [Vitrella brassicaformis CCMP3155]|mmetsp:Transcript_2464/g.5591  ORF Transcript_2464/g.5591 Transcript_2464/m.5591 type:complete len:155 (-) Transcript_2464:1935-2399(-)|eukprot:CEM07549.1 unnamed protein product [Vitrella brassicaformis CCMP3155]